MGNPTISTFIRRLAVTGAVLVAVTALTASHTSADHGLGHNGETMTLSKSSGITDGETITVSLSSFLPGAVVTCFNGVSDTSADHGLGATTQRRDDHDDTCPRRLPWSTTAGTGPLTATASDPDGPAPLIAAPATVEKRAVPAGEIIRRRGRP